jgi:hypothetical protein
MDFGFNDETVQMASDGGCIASADCVINLFTF